MNYALIENNIVANIIWLHPNNAHEFPNAVSLGDIPASIGDTYDGEHFYRDGKIVLTYVEQMTKSHNEELAEMDLALIEATYNNLIGGLE